MKTVDYGYYETTQNPIIDLFGTIGAMRNMDKEDKIGLFKNAFCENRELAMKILFYARDCRGGQGERDTFREIYTYLSEKYNGLAIANIPNIIELGRADDIIDISYKSKNPRFVESVIQFIKQCLNEDMKMLRKGQPVSLLAKWLPSLNTSSKTTVRKAKFLCEKLGMSPKQYRVTLSKLRKAIGVVETKITNKEYDKINYSTVPSLAMLKYKKAFYRNDESRFSKYIKDVQDGKTEIKADTLYPYDIVRSYLNENRYDVDDVLESQWRALPNYIGDNECDILPICDVSGSMRGIPMYMSVSLGIYIAERTKSFCRNNFVTFSEHPSIIKLNGKNLKENIEIVYNSDWGYNTNLEYVFDLILETALNCKASQDDLPSKLLVITDMEFDEGSSLDEPLLKSIEDKYKKHNYKLPKIIWWNVDAENTMFPMQEKDNALFVSGASPSIMKSILNDNVVSPIDIITDTVLTDRYSKIVYDL